MLTELLLAIALPSYPLQPGTCRASHIAPVVRAPRYQDTATQDKHTAEPKRQKKTAKDGDNQTGRASLDASVASEDETESAAPSRTFSWKQHPSLRLGALRVDFQAKIQGDMHRSYDGAQLRAGLDTFELQRSRVGIQGRFFEHIEFEIERDLSEQTLTPAELAEGLTPKSPWKDVNLNIDYVGNAQVQAGKFKIPFGLDELTSIAQNDFAYRSLGADYLAPARDIGVMVHGRFFKRGLNYWAGVFRHDGDNARSKNIRGGNRTFAARVTGTPLRRLKRARLDRLEVGTALAVSSVSDDSFRPNGLRGRTVMTEDTVFAAAYVKGHRRRWEGDIDWPLGRASVRAEYTYVTDDRIGQGVAQQDLPNARYRSWYMSGTYVVTGEDKTRPLSPRRPVLRGGAGAVELAGRYERLWRDSVGGRDVAFRNPRAETILPDGERVVTLGVNWILNRWMTIQANGIRERVQDPRMNPAPDGAAFWSRVLRLQFTL